MLADDHLYMNKNYIIYHVDNDQPLSAAQIPRIIQTNEVKWVNKVSKSKHFIALGSTILFLTLIAAVIMICISITAPCLLTKCAENATCHNRAFNPICKCNFGYNGKGKEYCYECGITYFRENSYSRIIGGNEAIKHSWPMAVLITFSYKTLVDLDGDTVLVSYDSFCGGTLIDISTVMTAAHCVLKSFMYEYKHKIYIINVTSNAFHPTIETMFTVYLGAHKTVLEDVDISPAKVFPVDNIIIHESYDDGNYLFDIALVKLAKPAILNEYVQLACLPYPKLETFKSGYNAGVVIGWGITEEEGTVARSLKNVRVNLYESSQCSNSTEDLETNWSSQICAGDTNGGRDSCQGDSGGSLFYHDSINGKKKYITIGIVSYGEGCGRANLPGIYTRVSFFLDWIEKNAFN